MGRSRRGYGAVGLVFLAALIGGFALPVHGELGSHAAAATANQPLTGAIVLSAFQTAGLPVTDQQYLHSRTGGPSGPPTPEREAILFRVPDIAPAGGIIYVFDDSVKLAKKSAWFTSVGAGTRTTTYRNILLWLDKSMPESEASRYRQALTGLK